MKAQADFARLTLRLPKDLQAMIKSSADENERSINAEVVARLVDSFDENASPVVTACQVNTDDLAAKIAEKVRYINALDKAKGDK